MPITKLPEPRDLSEEAVKAWISQQGIRKAEKWAAAYPNNDFIKNCLKQRKNPIEYLQKSFPHSALLLAVMGDTGCILSGSRAADFFVPGLAEF